MSLLSSVNAGDKTAIYFGCTSFYTGAGVTTVFAAVDGFSSTLDGTTTGFTTVSGLITMWAQPITVAYQSTDLGLFTTTTPSTSPSTTTSSTTSQSTTTTNSSSPSPTPTQTPGSSLSSGGIAGTVIGAAAVLAVVIGAAIYLRRKRKPPPPVVGGRDARANPPPPGGGYWQQRSGSTDNSPPDHHTHAHHEVQYDLSSQQKPVELQDRQRNPFAELPDQRGQRYELS